MFMRLACELVRKLRNLEPAQLRSFDFGTVASDAFGQRGEPVRIARVEVGVVQRRLVGSDLGLQLLDLAGQSVVITLVLVGELLVPRPRPGSGSRSLFRAFRASRRPGLAS